MKFRFVLVAGFCLFSIYSANTILSSLLPTIGREYSLSPAILGLIISAFGWSYATMQIPVGVLSDIFEPRNMTSLSMLAFFLSTLAFAFSPNGVDLILSRVLMGVGASFIFVTSLKGIEYVYELRERGLALGIFVSISFCGIAIPNLIASLLPLASTGSWRVVYLGASILPLIGSAASFALFPKKILKTDKENSERKSRRSLLSDFVPIIQNRKFMVQNVIAFIYFGSFFGVLFWLPSFLESRELTATLAGIAVFLLGIGGVSGFSLGGWLIHKYGKEIANLKFFLIIYACLIFAMILVPKPLVLYQATVLSFFVGMGLGGMVANNRIIGILFNKSNVGTAYGVFNTVGWLGSAFYPLVVGYLLSSGYAFPEAFLPLGISDIVAVALSLLFLKSNIG